MAAGQAKNTRLLVVTAELSRHYPGQIILEVEYRDRDLVRSLPGAKHIEMRRWRISLSWASCLAIRGVFGDRLQVGPELEAWAWEEYSGRVQPALEALDRSLDPTADSEGDPRCRRYQRTGSEFLVVSGGAVCGDDRGVGKTVTMIAALERMGAYPCLIVAERVGKRVWARHFAEWAPNRSVTVVSSSGAKRRRELEAETDVVITNYESLRTASRLAHYGNMSLTIKEKTPGPLNRPWAAVVADEAHKAKDPHSKQTRALWQVGDDATGPCYALTGTPGGPEDLWALLRFVAPEEFPSKTRFIDRYCTVTVGWHGGAEVTGLNPATEEEFRAAVNPRFMRRTKELVAPELPPKIGGINNPDGLVIRWVEMGAKQAKAYREMRDKQVAWLDGEPAAAFNGLSRLTRLQQFANAYAELVEDGEDEEGRPKFRVQLAEPSSKCDDIEELLDDMKGEPLGIFAASKQLINLLGARLDKAKIPYGRITGDENDRQRAQAEDDFQKGNLRALLLTYAGSTSITLTRANTCCFMQRSFGAIPNLQAEDRFHRIGQTADHVLVIDCIAPGTVEETVVKPALEGEVELFEEVVRDRDLMRRILNG